MSTARSLLIIDDDRLFNELVTRQLADSGYRVTGMRSWADARQWLSTHEPDLVLLDIRLPDAEGLEVLRELVPDVPVIVLTAYGSVRSAVEAIRFGAAEYLVKPVNLDELELAIARTLGHAELKESLKLVRTRERRSRKSFPAPARNWWRGKFTNALSGRKRTS